MKSKIRVLSDQTINTIAAGEVIENPASVVKELVENALDAGATEVTVEIKGGGRQSIRVSDNGCGMSADDALLCLERHATSKLREADDLHTIETLGFRGEAIPSIAAISKFSLLTRPAEDEKGTLVLVEGGKILTCAPAACQAGTTIEVQSLFFNVPVRKKFQRSPAYDVQEIQKMLSLLALGNPFLKLSLLSNKETLLSTHRSQTLAERIETVLGAEFTSSLSPIEGEREGIRIEGFIGDPAWTRHNRSGQHLFINRRGVINPLISYAVREGYGPLLPTQRHPVFVLHLHLPGTWVDVNVHPQKREVRLREEQTLKELLIRSIEKALCKTVLPEPSIPPLFDSPKRPFFQESLVPYPPLPAYAYSIPARQTAPELSLFEACEEKKTPPKVLMTLTGLIAIDPKTLPQPREEGICLVDQRLAHLRILYEKFKTAPNEISQQGLLIPYTLETSPLESARVKEHLLLLNRAGIGIKEFGPHTFVVDALPHFLNNTDVAELIQDLLRQMRETDNPNLFQKEQAERLAHAASYAAVSRRKKMNLEEAQGLINQLFLCQQPTHCPQGKSTLFFMGLDELSKRFST